MKIEHIFSSYPHRHSSIVTSLNPRALHQDLGTARSGAGTREPRGVPTELCICSLWPVPGALAATRWKVALAGNPTGLTQAPSVNAQSNESREPICGSPSSTYQRHLGKWGCSAPSALLFFFLKINLVKSFKRMYVREKATLRCFYMYSGNFLHYIIRPLKPKLSPVL